MSWADWSRVLGTAAAALLVCGALAWLIVWRIEYRARVKLRAFLKGLRCERL